jgi:hypothetical protein
VVVDLWFRKANGKGLDYREEGFVGGYKRYVLDAKGNVIPGKTPNLLQFQER